VPTAMIVPFLPLFLLHRFLPVYLEVPPSLAQPSCQPERSPSLLSGFDHL